MKKLGIYLMIDKSKSTVKIVTNIRNSLKRIMETLRTSRFLDGIDATVTVMLFNHNWEIAVNHCSLNKKDVENLTWEASGCTDIGGAILECLNKGGDEYREWRMDNIDCVHPCYILLTDGVPDAGKGCTPEEQQEYEDAFMQAANQIKAGEASKLTFGIAGICGNGYKADMNKLRQLTNNSERVIELDGNNPKEAIEETFLHFVSQTVATTTGEDDGIF